MARTYWNGVVVMVAALGLGGSMSWFLFAQSPDAPADRYVTIDVSNEKVRCKILKSWSLPDGGRAYQVKSVESGDMITVVRQNAGAGEKDAFVRVYKWRDATTPPVGAPEPPASVAGPQNNVAPSTTAEKMPTKTKTTPPIALKDSKNNQSPYATIIHKTSPKVAANTPKETIVTIPDQPDVAATGSDGLARSKPPLPAPRKESGFDNSVDQLGQAPWAKEDAAAELPGKITVEGASEKNGVQLAAAEVKPESPARPNLEPMFALPSALKVEPKSEPKVTPPAPKLEEKFAPKAQPSVAPPPLPLPPLPASELPPPHTLPILAESTILTPPPLPAAEAKGATLPAALTPPALTPTVLTPPALPPMLEIAAPALPKLETAPPSAGAPPPPLLEVDRGAVMVPPYEGKRVSIYDRLIGRSARSHAIPAAAASNAANLPPINLREIASKSADASAGGDLRPQTTIVLGPTVIVQSSATKTTIPEAPMHVDRFPETSGDAAPIVSKMSNFNIPQTSPANDALAPTEPIVPPYQLPNMPAAPPQLASSMPPIASTMPVVDKEVEHHAANNEIVDANPPLLVPPPDFAQNRSGAPSNINIPKPGLPQLPRDGSVNRTRTTITPGQAAAPSSTPPTILAQATYVDAVSPTVVADHMPVVTKIGNAASPPSSIEGLLSGPRSERPAAPQRTLTGSLFGGSSATAAKQVITVNPEMNSSRETIVTLNEGTGQYENPVVIKKATASTPRATSIVGLMSGFFDKRTSAKTEFVAAPELAPQYPVVVIGDRNRLPNGPGPMTVAGPVSPAGFPNETIIEVTDGQYASANAAPVVEKRSTTDINRSTTIVGLMGVNQMAAPYPNYAYRSPYASSGVAGHSFDRRRTTISADQVAAIRPAGQPSAAMEPIVITSDAPPVVQTRKTALFDRSTKIAGMVGGNRATATDVAFPVMPPGDGQGKISANQEVWPPQQIAMPQPNPIQQASHNAPVGTSGMTVPANAAMDRPVTAAALNSGDQAALTKLMQSAKGSPQPSQRELAVIALSSYDGRSLPQLVTFLNQLAINDPAAAVRASAVNALMRMNVAPESVVHTLETLRGDADTRVRQAVAEATSAFGLGNQ